MSTHAAETNKVTEVTLPSGIEQVLWTGGRAAPGGATGLVVFTHFVGNGAPIQFTLTDHSGKAFGTFTDTIHANRFSATLRVPTQARDALYVEVRLPKHGLSQKSAALPLTRPVELRNARWDTDATFHGAVHRLSAEVEGVSDGAEVQVAIFQHDDDGTHERLTYFPAYVKQGRVEVSWAFQFQGNADDLLSLLADGGTGPRYFFKVELGGAEVVSEPIPLTWMIVELVGEDGWGVPHERYRVELPDGAVREGRLDGRGRACLVDVEAPGSGTVSFPDLDKAAWEPTAA